MPRFNPNVRYEVRQEGNMFIVINLDRNRRMRKTFVTRREANAHVAQTKNRVAQIIGYHNRAPAGAQRNNRNAPPPAYRRPVPNVGRRVNGRVGRPRRAPQAADGARRRNAPATPPRRNNANAIQRANTVRRERRRRTQATPVARRTRAAANEGGSIASRVRRRRKKN